MQIYITDKSGKKFWNTNVSAGFASGERNNMSRRLSSIKSGNKAFGFVDSASARIVEEYEGAPEISDEELLAELAK